MRVGTGFAVLDFKGATFGTDGTIDKNLKNVYDSVLRNRERKHFYVTNYGFHNTGKSLTLYTVMQTNHLSNGNVSVRFISSIGNGGMQLEVVDITPEGVATFVTHKIAYTG